MNRFFALFAALALLALPAAASAAPSRPGPYVSVFVGGGVPVNQDATSTDFSFNQFYDDRVEFDPGVTVGGTGGYDFGFVRLEGELAYKYSEISSVRDMTNGASYGNLHGSVGVFSTMANCFVDLHNDSPVTPYIGGGIGVATLYIDDTTGIRQGAGGTRVMLYYSGNDTVFAYQLGAGLEIALNRRLSLDLGYRYFATTSASFNDSFLDTEMKFESHNGTVGLRFKF